MSPLYEFSCVFCGESTEKVYLIKERPRLISCTLCGGTAERIISSQILRNEPTWLDSAKRQLQPGSRDQIRDRNDFERHLKREGVEQVG